jgi:hypothetical protein
MSDLALENILPGVRRAVLVGINDYQDSNITKLHGAVDDAKELCDRLKSRGRFEIITGEALVNEKATSRNIRKAISDLLWQTDEGKLAVFYFSGHGFRDSRGHGYIAPYDMVKDEPYVCGIDMQDIKDVVLESNKEAVFMFLDCCFSGISAKGDEDVSLTPYFKNFEADATGQVSAQGKGKVVFASSESDKASAEKDDCVDVTNQTPHCHGDFSFHLIEGLDGRAANSAGVITFGALQDHVENEVFNEGKQKPQFFATGASKIRDIRIAIQPVQVKGNIELHISEAKDSIAKGDIVFLIGAIDDTNKVLMINNQYKEALDLKKQIEEILNKYRDNITLWWSYENQSEVKNALKYVPSIIDEIIDNMSFDQVALWDKKKRTLFVNLFNVSGSQKTLDFIKRCRVYDNPPS